jgi:ferredoxin-type protein NapF
MNKIYLNLFYKIHKINLSLFLFSFISFLIILFLSLIKGRLYCNTICPVGTLLGYISKYSILKISIDQVQCTSCSLCEKVCKASCIDSKNKKVDLSRCISCYNCLDICPQNAIEYKRVTNQTNVDYSRRNFIKYIFPTSLFSIALLGSVIRKPFIALRNNSKIFKKKIISPPGSQSISHFLDSCTACHICVNSCPSKVLKPAGFLGIMQPTLDYSYAFCDYECNICTQVCPSGAIKPFKLEKKKKVQIGKVKLIKEQCIVYKSNLDCGACAEHCPTTAVYTVPYKGMYGPEVNTDYCIGCGACEYACPAVPEKAIIVEGNDIHQMAQERPREKVKEQPEKQLLDEENVEEEFPF